MIDVSLDQSFEERGSANELVERGGCSRSLESRLRRVQDVRSAGEELGAEVSLCTSFSQDTCVDRLASVARPCEDALDAPLQLTAIDQNRVRPLPKLFIQPFSLLHRDALMYESSVNSLIPKSIGEGNDMFNVDSEDES